MIRTKCRNRQVLTDFTHLLNKNLFGKGLAFGKRLNFAVPGLRSKRRFGFAQHVLQIRMGTCLHQTAVSAAAAGDAVLGR